MQNNQVKKDVDVYSNVPDWLCTYSAWNNLVSGTLPTSSSKKRPYGQGEMLAFFTIFFFAFSKPYYRRNDDFRGSWVTILESFCYSDMPWSIHVPQESPKVGKRVDFRVPPGFLWHPV